MYNIIFDKDEYNEKTLLNILFMDTEILKIIK